MIAAARRDCIEAADYLHSKAAYYRRFYTIAQYLYNRAPEMHATLISCRWRAAGAMMLGRRAK